MSEPRHVPLQLALRLAARALGDSAEPVGSPSQPKTDMFAVMSCHRKAHVGSTPQGFLQERKTVGWLVSMMSCVRPHNGGPRSQCLVHPR